MERFVKNDLDDDRRRLDFLERHFDPQQGGIVLRGSRVGGLIVIMDGHTIPPGRISLRQAIDAVMEQGEL